MSGASAAVPVAASAEATPGALQRARRIWHRNRLLVVGGTMTIMVVLLVLIGPLFAPYGPNDLGGMSLSPPSSAHLMGTDQFGRDVFSRWLYGGRVSLEVAGGSVALSMVIGGAAGLLAGYWRGAFDGVIARFADAILSIPFIVLVVATTGVVGPTGFSVAGVHIGGATILILLLGFAFLPLFIRLARASALAEMEEDYITAARALGMRTPRIVMRNLLPNVLPALVIQAAFTLAVAIGAEAIVSFLGFGIQPPESSWGTMLNGARDYLLEGAWWLLAFPAAIIVFSVFSFNVLGDGLRDLLDPRHRSRVVEEVT
jgi:ABC-type dipeptide/oligopeptide/nickel transport system permease subunit